MKVRERLYEVALEKGLRQSTLVSYETLLGRLGLLDTEVEQVGQQAVLDALWAIQSPNSRRSAVVAVRSVLGLQIKIPKGVPRRYTLPDEDTLRLALMTSPHEVRALTMLYCGLRVGEACAVTGADVIEDRLRVDKQVVQVHRTGYPTVTRIGPVKANEAEVVIPHWLARQVLTLTTTTKPDTVRESLRRAGLKVGIRLNPHMLRHACATMLLERGVPMLVVSGQLRHSDIATTLRTYAQHDSGRAIHDAFG